jgi:hypothetical protein
MVLGMDWLEQHSPMQYDWVNKSLSFLYKGQQITLQGIKQQPIQQLSEIYEERLLKWHKGNYVWAMVVLSAVTESEAFQEQYMINGISSAVQEAILEFDTLFQTPTELPPSRAFDHPISLLPDTVPNNCRPYRYAQ